MTTRRSFIQQLSAPLLAMPFLSSREEEKPFDGRVLRVAIMGLGSYGTRVAEAMKDCRKAKLVGVISGTPSKITELAVEVWDTCKELLQLREFRQDQRQP